MPYRTITSRDTITNEEYIFVNDDFEVHDKIKEIQEKNKHKDNYRAHFQRIGTVDSRMINDELDNEIKYNQILLYILIIWGALFCAHLIALIGLFDGFLITIILFVYFLFCAFMIPYAIIKRIEATKSTRTLVHNFGKIQYSIHSSWIVTVTRQEYYEDTSSNYTPSSSRNDYSSSASSNKRDDDWIRQRELQKKTHGSISSYNRNRQQQMRRIRP